MEITGKDNIHELIHKLVVQSLEKYEKEFEGKNNIKIFYDKVSYRINVKEIYERFTFVSNFKMVGSTHSMGIQFADWIVGDASNTFRQQKN